jgi:hypothetical protein
MLCRLRNGPGLKLADNRHRHRLTHVQYPAGEDDTLRCVAALKYAHDAGRLGDSLLRTQCRTTATAMTKLRKDKRLLTHYRNGVVLAHLGTPATVRAAFLVHLRDQDANLPSLVEDRLEEQVGIGRFDVTIQKQGRRARLSRGQAECQADGYCGFAGAPLPLATVIIMRITYR